MERLKTKEFLPLPPGKIASGDAERLLLRHAFLVEHGLEATPLLPLPADCSYRRYFRLPNALLMDAPPPHESTSQFHFIAEILQDAGLSVPLIYAADHDRGFLLIEDFGDLPYRKAIHSGICEKILYGETVKALAHLHQESHLEPNCHLELVSGSRDNGSRSRNKFGMTLREDPRFQNKFRMTIEEKGNCLPTYALDLFVEKSCLFLEWADLPLSEQEIASYKTLWEEAYLNQPSLPWTLAMRDVMIDNLLWLPEREGFKRCGFIDFQDGALAPISYDLVSLLEDARWDIRPSFAMEMMEIYFESFPELSRDDFWASYCLWGAQRTVRIMGVFLRQAKRYGRSQYLTHLPRLWKILERDLSHSSLIGLKGWFASHGGLK